MSWCDIRRSVFDDIFNWSANQNQRVRNPIKKSETKPRRFALLTKGADSAVFARLADKEKYKLHTAEGHVNRFARDGLRTLAFGRRYLTEEETINIRNKIIEAEASVNDSSNQLQEIYKEIETDLEFLGWFRNCSTLIG